MSATRISGEPGYAGAFAVPSASMPGEHWIVEFVGVGVRWCGCPAFQRKQSCRHADEVDALIQAEARTATTPETRARAAARLAEIELEMSR